MTTDQELVQGALVRWPNGPGSPIGYIREVAAASITVRFDGGEERMFARRNAPLERVTLPPQVRRRSTDEPGFLVGPIDGAAEPTWRVQLVPSGLKNLPEADLRPDMPSDPLGKFAAGDLGSPRAFNLRTVAKYYLLEHMHNDLVSLAHSRVDLKPHQVAVAHRVVTNYPHRFLLCDEVGLGKTIEAGMILKELRARGHAQRTLVIVPPNLVRQWQFELKSKFNETFSILNRDTVRYLRNQGLEGNPFADYDSVIVSSGWITGKKWREFCTEVSWDMIIVDEAHHARRRRWGGKTQITQLYNLVRELADTRHFSKRAMLFLTATPMQLGSDELYSLIELLDPTLFPSEEHFNRHRKEVPGLSRLVDELQTHGFPVPDRDPDEVVRGVAIWLGLDEELARKRLSADQDEIESLCAELSDRHLLSEVLLRNRKVVVGGFMPRRADRWRVRLSEREKVALDAVEEYVQNGYDRARATRDNAVGFVMTVFQRLMASSIRALTTSLERRKQRLLGLAETTGSPLSLEDTLAEDTGASNLVMEANPFAEEAEELDRVIALMSEVRVDSKAETLVANMGTLLREEPGAKVLIFTEFLETQAYLRELLQEQGWGVHLFHGQMTAQAKDAEVEAFRDATGASVLISTDSGGEGRNFQFCHLMVNYDLPWNPMKVEQRIGRIDRIGQEHIVQVFNLWVEGTIEERILNVLENRIRIFEDTVGSLDPILGEMERELTDILRRGREDREQALARFEERIERDVEKARDAEEKLRDFITDTKSFSREIAERITGQASPISAEDQERFVKQLLAQVKTFIERLAGGEFQIVFHEPFLTDFPDLAKERKRRVVFRSDEKRDSEQVEYLTFGHPVVDGLVERVLQDQFGGAASSRRLFAEPGVEATSGWLFNYVISVPGIKTIERFVPVFVSDSGEVSLAIGEWLLEKSRRMDREEGAPVPESGWNEAAGLALREVESEMHQLRIEVNRQWSAQSAREREKLEGFFEYRERSARDRIESTAATLARLESSEDSEQRKIIPVWRANLERDERVLEELDVERTRRLREVDLLEDAMPDNELLNVARIEIVEVAS